MRRSASLALVVAIVAHSAPAQRVDELRAGVSRPPVSAAMATRADDKRPALLAHLGWGAATPGPRGRSISWLDPDDARRIAPLASAILPGAGQYLLGEDRFLAYAAIEAGFWIKRVNDQADRRRQERRFRDYARNVARSPFGTNLPDGDWAYYEEMRFYPESGAFSLVEGSVVPETDSVTFNGFIWRAAQAHNPDHQSALAEYMARAIRPEMQWSWRDAQLQWDLFKRATEARNNAAGRAAFDLIVIGANHVISMVDAFTTIRLKVRPGARGGLEIGGTLPRR